MLVISLRARLKAALGCKGQQELQPSTAAKGL